MKFDLEEINKHIEEGWVVKNDHPTLPIAIYNYTRYCTFEKHWNEITLACRGLVLDNEGNVIARPFPKFFNWEELLNRGEEIPDEEYEILIKEDGSLGIIFYYQGVWILASRGSFTSDQSQIGQRMLNKYYCLDDVNQNVTLVVEIIYPANRIVVNYGDAERLVLLGSMMNDTGKEGDFIDLVALSTETGLPLVKHIRFEGTFEELKSQVPDNSEGYVIKFKSGLKMKIKGEEYCRLHRIITNVSNIDIYNTLKDGLSIEELLQNIPDEFDGWVHTVINDIHKDFADVMQQATIYYQYVMAFEGLSRKQQAELIFNDVPKKYVAILFKMLDNHPYNHLVYKQIRPKHSKPFSTVGTTSSIYSK